MATILKPIQTPSPPPIQWSGGDGIWSFPVRPDGNVLGGNPTPNTNILGLNPSDPLGFNDFRADVERDLPSVLVGGAVLVAGFLFIIGGINVLSSSTALRVLKG